MRILIVGGGGREHAIAWKLAQDPRVKAMFFAPGNAGMAALGECLPVKAEDVEGVCRAAMEKAADLVVIGPEVPLAMGMVDALQEQGIRAFGPNRKCARLEASKSFTKAFLARHGIPTADYREFSDPESLRQAIGLFGWPMVLKADGLAAGKGVILAADRQEAEKAVDEMMGQKIFGAAGEKVVVEECLRGVEASVLCFVDRHTIVPMESAQDYKRIFDGDRGPNTGGMGAYSPSLLFNEELEDRISKEILEPTLKGFQADGLDFQGVLFVGLMITEQGPKVIEFNNRFGDPETQAVLPRLESSLLDIFNAVTEDRLAEMEIRWSPKRAVCVGMASAGYPGSYEKGKEIFGLDRVDPDVVVFHAGTAAGTVEDGGGQRPAVVTAGGRVLGVTALGDSHQEAREKAFANVERISFEGAQYRKDIGLVGSTL
ncbi:MAG: phosphoribosylamine--glycine ligase, partial [Bacillota bacterium]|nr:phosphoribosylamine--glycine ligase [Bacillota bacterium]